MQVFKYERGKEDTVLNKAWWKEAVVYQIYPRSFMDSNGDGIGDINGITEKLEYLQELGIDVIWLSPVYQSPNDDNGYDISDYQAIMTEFGTMEDFDRMLSRAHELGIKIMMDLVVNHTSDEHAWFVESKKSVDNPYRDFYIWRKGKEDGSEPNNWGSCFSGSAWKYDPQTDMYFLHLFSKKQPDLNWDNPKVRDRVFDMMNWWCEKGIDGFRMDVISLISKPEGLPDGIPGETGYADSGCANGPHVHEYLKEMNRKVLSHYDLITVGEAAGVTLEEAKKYANADGSELNMVFQFEHTGGGPEADNHYGKWDSHKMPLPVWKKILSRWQTGLEGKAWNSLFLSNHDQPRSVSWFGNDSEQYREISAKMLGTCLHMMQGTPYVYQGEELGMCNAYFDQLEDYRDIESLNAYKELTETCGVSHEEMMGYLKRISRDTLVGCAPELIRYYMELRGIGVINVRHLYGMGAVKPETNIDLVVSMEPWEDGKAYDRLGLTNETASFLGVSLPQVTIPVRPGRNLAVIMELAAMNNRQKKMGYNAAETLASNVDHAVDNGTF